MDGHWPPRCHALGRALPSQETRHLNRRDDDVPISVEQLVMEHALPPAHLLEVGCGAGELAQSLSRHGYDVTAIDPEAPSGEIFQTTSLEDFTSSSPFEVVVANRSLHHIADLSDGLRKIRSLLIPGGVLVLNEFAWDQMDQRTARWYLSHVGDPRPEDESLLHGKSLQAWIAEHEGLHDSGRIRRALDELFEKRLFNWVPYIAEHYLKRLNLIKQEAELIRSETINPMGFHYVGIRRSTERRTHAGGAQS
jgi:SAM-dependent methyltransferase